MAVVGRIFEWFQHFLEIPGGPGAGPKEISDILVPIIPAFGTGRLTRKFVRNERIQTNGIEAIGTAPSGTEVRFVFALHFLHNQAAVLRDLGLFLRVQIGGTDFDVLLQENENVATSSLQEFTRPYLIPGDCRLVLKELDGVSTDSLIFQYHFVVLQLGETSWWPGGGSSAE